MLKHGGAGRVVDALQHPRRVQSMQHVRAHPGCTFRSVVRGTGISAGTVQHHMRVLSKHKHLVIDMRGSRMALFDSRTGPAERRMSPLRDTGLHDIYHLVERRGPCCQKDALNAAAMPRSSAQHRLNRLVRLGLVQSRPMGRRIIYEVAAPATKA